MLDVQWVFISGMGDMVMSRCFGMSNVIVVGIKNRPVPQGSGGFVGYVELN